MVKTKVSNVFKVSISVKPLKKVIRQFGLMCKHKVNVYVVEIKSDLFEVKHTSIQHHGLGVIVSNKSYVSTFQLNVMLQWNYNVVVAIRQEPNGLFAYLPITIGF
jgi:hypothetical protein